MYKKGIGMKKKTQTRIIILTILASVVFILGMIWFFVWKTDEIPAQIIGVLFGTIVSAVITMLLLSAQTSSEEEHEVSGKIFDKKTEAYLKVLDSLEKIISDGKVDTIRDNRFEGKKDEFSELLFGLTRLSSFIERKKVGNEKDSENDGMNGLIEAVTEIINTTTDERTRIPGVDEKNFWDGKGKMSPSKTQKAYYEKLAESLKKISSFAENNIQRSSNKQNEEDFKLEALISDSGLFPENENVENKILVANNNEQKEESSDYRINCIVECLTEMESQLKNTFGNVKRKGNGGDDYCWGRWMDNDTTPEAIAYWLLEKPRRNEIGYTVDLNDGFKADLYLSGDGKTFVSYISASEEKLKQIQEKHDEIKKSFGEWWVPDNFVDSGWIIGGGYGGEYNGVNLSFDFRNSGNLTEKEYLETYEKFESSSIQGIISGRGDSIVKAVEDLKKILQG